MSYALIKNIPLNTGLFTRTPKDKIDWPKYGLKFSAEWGTSVGRHAAEAGEDEGLFHNVIFIEDLEKFKSQLPNLQAYCVKTPNPLDSVEIISDEEALDCKNCIVKPVSPDVSVGLTKIIEDAVKKALATT